MGCLSLAIFLENGIGIQTSNLKEAIRFFYKAHLQGSKEAKNRLQSVNAFNVLYAARILLAPMFLGPYKEPPPPLTFLDSSSGSRYFSNGSLLSQSNSIMASLSLFDDLKVPVNPKSSYDSSSTFLSTSIFDSKSFRQSPLLCLPNEILEHILSFLNRDSVLSSSTLLAIFDLARSRSNLNLSLTGSQFLTRVGIPLFNNSCICEESCKNVQHFMTRYQDPPLIEEEEVK